MKTLEARSLSRSSAVVSGFGSRDVVMKVTTRSPVWSNAERGWVVQPHRLPDIIAVAESRGYTVLLDAELSQSSMKNLVRDSDKSSQPTGRPVQPSSSLETQVGELRGDVESHEDSSPEESLW